MSFHNGHDSIMEEPDINVDTKVAAIERQIVAIGSGGDRRRDDYAKFWKDLGFWDNA